MNNEEEKTVYALQNPEDVRKMYKALSIIGEHLEELKADMEEKSIENEHHDEG
jgi:hypothetical protein